MTRAPHPRPGETACHACDAPLAADQRYCVLCGARRFGSAHADPLALLFGASAGAGAAGSPGAAGAAAPGAPAPARPPLGRRRRAALPVALATLVGLVVVTGSTVPASLAGYAQPPFTVVLPPLQVASTPSPPPADDAFSDPLPLPAPPVQTPVAPPLAPSVAPPAAAPVEQAPADSGTDAPPADAEPAASPIQHVFLVVLGDADVAALAQDRDAAPYLTGTLKPSGTLLTDYRTVASGALANGVALVSGQGPTAQTLADCPQYGDVRPADPLPEGQVEGDGCVYGYETGTIGDQLRGLGREWRAYVEAAPAAAAATDAEPACGGPDATRRNPFLAFHGVIDDAGECARRNVGLDLLADDLADPDLTPALSYITSAVPAGSAGADAFLERVVPQILNSQAYATGGLIVITADRPAPAAPTAPPPATEPPPATTPTPAPPAPPPATQPAPTPPAPEPPPTTTPTEPPPTPPTETTPTTPPTETAPTEPPPTQTTPTTPTTPPTQTTPTTPPPATTPTPPPTQTTPNGPSATTAPPATAAPSRAGAGDGPRASAAGASRPAAHAAADAPADAADPAADPCCGPRRYPNVGDAAEAGAGQPVGALLISPFVAAGRAVSRPASHFTLLRTLEDLFGLDPLGYAASDDVTALPDGLFSVKP